MVAASVSHSVALKACCGSQASAECPVSDAYQRVKYCLAVVVVPASGYDSAVASDEVGALCLCLIPTEAEDHFLGLETEVQEHSRDLWIVYFGGDYLVKQLRLVVHCFQEIEPLLVLLLGVLGLWTAV
jgi:hypothetical protein